MLVKVNSLIKSLMLIPDFIKFISTHKNGILLLGFIILVPIVGFDESIAIATDLWPKINSLSHSISSIDEVAGGAPTTPGSILYTAAEQVTEDESLRSAARFMGNTLDTAYPYIKEELDGGLIEKIQGIAEKIYATVLCFFIFIIKIIAMICKSLYAILISLFGWFMDKSSSINTTEFNEGVKNSNGAAVEEKPANIKSDIEVFNSLRESRNERNVIYDIKSKLDDNAETMSKFKEDLDYTQNNMQVMKIEIEDTKKDILKFRCSILKYQDDMSSRINKIVETQELTIVQFSTQIEDIEYNLSQLVTNTTSVLSNTMASDTELLDLCRTLELFINTNGKLPEQLNKELDIIDTKLSGEIPNISDARLAIKNLESTSIEGPDIINNSEYKWERSQIKNRIRSYLDLINKNRSSIRSLIRTVK